MRMIDYRLYLVTDDPSRYSGNWLDNVVEAVEGGVTCVQYRDTESVPAERLSRVRALQDALKRHGTPVVVNNDAELAAAVGAQGVHVGQSDMPPEQVRHVVGPGCEIGLSITDLAQVARLGHGPAVDCVGIGPVFDARKTKADASDAIGLATLAEIVRGVVGSGVSTVAIGGIALANASEVLATGVGGLAVVSAFSGAADPFAVAKSFRSLFR